MGEFIFNLILLLSCIALLINSFSIEILEGYIGARYWPMFFLLLVAILLAIKTRKAWLAIPKENRKCTSEFFAGIRKSSSVRFMLAVLICLLYVLALPKIGFLFATFLFGAAFSYLLGAKSTLKMLISGLAVTIPIYAIFVWGLNIRLPRGIGFFYNISIFVERLL